MTVSFTDIEGGGQIFRRRGTIRGGDNLPQGGESKLKGGVPPIPPLNQKPWVGGGWGYFDTKNHVTPTFVRLG